MPWLARLDARADRWPLVARASYWCLKWGMVGLGVYLAVGLAGIELHEKRVGLGLGILAALVFGGLKGVLMAFRSPDRPRPPRNAP